MNACDQLYQLGHHSFSSINSQHSFSSINSQHSKPKRRAPSRQRPTHMASPEGSLSPHPQSPFTLALGVTTPSQPGGRSSYGCHTRAVSAWDRWPLFWKYAL